MALHGLRLCIRSPSTGPPGADVRFSVLPNRGHDILDVYGNRELYSWFLQHRLNDRLTRIGTK
jgi:hypothetical protein